MEKTTNRQQLKYALVCVLVGFMFHACVPTRELQEANTEVPDQYVGVQGDSINTAQVPWRDFFKDPQLLSLIDSALVNNQELKIMLAQIGVAKNEILDREGEILPSLGLQLGADIDKVGRYTSQGANDANTEIRPGEEFPEPLPDFSARFVATWELDVWKKLRNSKKAAVLEYLATVEGRNFMVTQLVSEIADVYYELLAYDNQLAILDQNLEIQERGLQMVRLQKQAAKANELGVKRFEAEVAKNQSRRFEVKQRIIELENELNFLTGSMPQSIARNSEVFLDIPVDTLHAGVPSQLLENRSDIRGAELELQAAELDIQVAKANFYPAFTIQAGIGLEAFSTKYLTAMPQSMIYSLVGDMVAPLINRKAIKADYFTANDRQLQAVYEYEKAVLSAFIEVSNQLSNLQNLKRSFGKKTEQVAALTESVELSNRLFQSARADYLEVLLTQREALESKMELVETQKDQLMAQVDLYQSLGGGWQ